MNPSELLVAAFREALRRRADDGWTRGGAAQPPLDALLTSFPTGFDDNLAEIAVRFGLSEIDLTILSVAAIAELHPAAHALCGILSGDVGPGRPTAALALELAGLSPADPEGRARFADLAPLIRHGLLELPGTEVLLARRLLMPLRVAAQLAGNDLPAPSLLALLIDPVAVRLPLTDTVAAALRGGEPLIWVQSAPGAAGSSLAAGACAQLNVPCLLADLSRVPMRMENSQDADVAVIDAPAVEAALRALVLEAGLTGAILIVQAAERAAAAMHVLLGAPIPVFAVSAHPWNPSWSNELPTTVRAPRLTFADRERQWQPVLGSPVPREITALRLTPEDIVRVTRYATREAALAGRERATASEIRQAVRRLGRGRHAGAADSPGVSVTDLILPQHAASEVARLLDWVRYRDELLALGPLQGKGGKGTGICALFSGGPGTGKTLAAHVVADTLGMDLLQVDLSSVVSKYIGETEQNLEKIFAEAESLNAVLFFDEADSLFGSRSEIKDARDRYANQEIAYLLQRMEQFDGITVLATNLRGNLDPAFARRLHFIINFPDPDEATRALLWRHHLAALGGTDPDDPVDVPALAEALDLAGGDIRNVVLSAAYAAIATGRSVGMTHVRAAVVREYAKLGRRVPARDFLALDGAGALAPAAPTAARPIRTSTSPMA